MQLGLHGRATAWSGAARRLTVKRKLSVRPVKQRQTKPRPIKRPTKIPINNVVPVMTRRKGIVTRPVVTPQRTQSIITTSERMPGTTIPADTAALFAKQKQAGYIPQTPVGEKKTNFLPVLLAIGAGILALKG